MFRFAHGKMALLGQHNGLLVFHDGVDNQPEEHIEHIVRASVAVVACWHQQGEIAGRPGHHQRCGAAAVAADTKNSRTCHCQTKCQPTCAHSDGYLDARRRIGIAFNRVASSADKFNIRFERHLDIVQQVTYTQIAIDRVDGRKPQRLHARCT